MTRPDLSQQIVVAMDGWRPVQMRGAGVNSWLCEVSRRNSDDPDCVDFIEMELVADPLEGLALKVSQGEVEVGDADVEWHEFDQLASADARGRIIQSLDRLGATEQEVEHFRPFVGQVLNAAQAVSNNE